MTPDQLERIKAYIGKAEYSGGYIFRENDSDEYGVSNLCNVSNLSAEIGQFIADAINEKLERMKPVYPGPNRPLGNGSIQVLPPIQLKNLKDPE